MPTMRLLVRLSLLVFFGSVSCQDAGTYTGAVVEFNSLWNFSLTTEQNVLNNAARYTKLIQQAASHEADIVVFPEMGMVGKTNTYFVEVPDPKEQVAPWEIPTANQVIRTISKAAKDNRIYVVINVLEKLNTSLGTLKYNTNVVFDQRGTVIARYRKFNLFGEEYLNRTKEPEHVTFTTNFGVTFGTFTCFDILFPDPANILVEKYNVTDIVFPTFWFSELPFLTALQAQQGWALFNKVNLLAAGQNLVGAGSSGSGVYSPWGNIQYTIQSVSEFSDRLIVGTVYKKGSSPTSRNGSYETTEGSSKSAELKLLKEDLTPYSTKLLSIDLKGAQRVALNEYRIVKQEGLCQNDFCCSFTLDYNLTLVEKNKWKQPTSLKGDEFYFFRYRLAARDGVRSFTGKYNGGVQICAVIPCLTESFDTCAVQTSRLTVDKPLVIRDENGADLALFQTMFNSITIQGVFQADNTSIWPNAMDTNPASNQFGRLFPRFDNFALKPIGNKVEARLTVRHSSEPTKLVIGALYGRVFDRDSPVTASASTWTTSHSISSLIIAATASLIARNIFHYFF